MRTRATLLLTALCLVGLFSTEISDTDFWWHLKTGQSIVEKHSLPVPDPFAYTSSLPAAFPGEQQVRHFNLTHEWLSQVLMYGVFAVAGFPGMVIARALLLAILCGLSGLLAGRSTSNTYAGILAACGTASVLVAFTADRPALLSFLGVAVFVTLMEMRRSWWALPPLALVWANCHGGFFLGWIVLLAYALENWRNRKFWLVTACSIAISGLNPNGFSVVSTVLAYRRSPLTTSLVEWQAPKLWGAPYGFDILLYAAALVLVISWKRVKPAHWILFAAFAGASLIAFRNIPLIGFLAPVLIAAYLPTPVKTPVYVAWASLLVAAFWGFSQGFQRPQVAEWTIPTAAADYLVNHNVTGPIFNTYEQGGYLIWRLSPRERVFIDGRSLSETAYKDYKQILFNAGSVADQVTGPREQLLNRYGVRVVAMNTMDYPSGALYPLALALANPASTDWELVYDDAQEVIFMRHPPPEIPVLSNKLGRVLRHMNTECAAYIENSPDTPLCARTLGDYWLRNQAKEPARRMLQLYLSHVKAPDEQAESSLRRLNLMP